MARYDIPENEYETAGARVAIVAARFNHEVVDLLLQGALSALERHGIEGGRREVVRVPGAFELPLAARVLLESGCDAVIALGAVVRGDTPHFDYVCTECARGISQVSLDTRRPVIFGILTTDTMAQALARAGGEHGNKGHEAALAALEMLTLLSRVKTADRDSGRR